MAPQASWRGFLKLSLVSCPVRVAPATSRAARVAFHRIDRRTHHRIEMWPHDAETGEPVDRDDLVRGFEAEKGRFVLVEDDELRQLQIDSSRTIELDRFVPAGEIDWLYLDAPYHVAPDGPVAVETFRVVETAMRERKVPALGRVVLGSRERMVAVEPRGEAMLLTTLRPAEEVRDPKEYFADVADAPVDPDMLELAVTMIGKRTGRFDPKRLEDRYQAALRRLIEEKEKGGTPVGEPEAPGPAPVIDLMAALKRSLEASAGAAAPPKKHAAAKARAARKAPTKAAATKKRR